MLVEFCRTYMRMQNLEDVSKLIGLAGNRIEEAILNRIGNGIISDIVWCYLEDAIFSQTLFHVYI